MDNFLPERNTEATEASPPTERIRFSEPWLNLAYLKLTDRERQVINLRFPPDGIVAVSQREAAARLDLTKTRVLALERTALKKLLDFSNLPLDALATCLKLSPAQVAKLADARALERPVLPNAARVDVLVQGRYLNNLCQIPFLCNDPGRRTITLAVKAAKGIRRVEGQLTLEAEAGFPGHECVKLLVTLVNLYAPWRDKTKIFFGSDRNLLLLMQDPQAPALEPSPYAYRKLRGLFKKLTGVKLTGTLCWFNRRTKQHEDIAEHLTLFPGVTKRRRQDGEIVAAHLQVNEWFADRFADDLFSLRPSFMHALYQLSDGAVVLGLYLDRKISRYGQESINLSDLCEKLGFHYKNPKDARRRIREHSVELQRAGVLTVPAAFQGEAWEARCRFSGMRRRSSLDPAPQPTVMLPLSVDQEYVLDTILEKTGERNQRIWWRTWVACSDDVNWLKQAIGDAVILQQEERTAGRQTNFAAALVYCAWLTAQRRGVLLPPALQQIGERKAWAKS